MLKLVVANGGICIAKHGAYRKNRTDVIKQSQSDIGSVRDTVYLL